MVALYGKDALKLGTAYVPDGEGGRRVEHFTPERLDHLTARVEDMLKAGLNIPICKEHQSTARPRTRQEYDRYLQETVDSLCGHTAEGFRHPDGHLEIIAEAPTPEDEATLARCRFVSPEIIEDFTDGSGRLWPGESISHFAVTGRPVQHDQKPWRPITNGQASSGVAVALSQNSGGQGAATGSRYPLRLSLDDFSEDAPVDEEMETTPAETTPETPEMPDAAPVTESGDEAMCKRCIELLKGHDPAIVLSDECTDCKDLVGRLVAALEALNGREASGMETTGTEPPPENPNETPQPVQETPTMLSLQRDLATAKAELAKHRKVESDHKRGVIGRRIEALKDAQFLPATEAAEYTKRLGTLALSLAASTPLECEIAALERAAVRAQFLSPRQLDLSLIGPEAPSPVEPPEEEEWSGQGPMPEAKQEKILAFMDPSKRKAN